MDSGELRPKKMGWSLALTTTITTTAIIRRRRSVPAPTAPPALTPTPQPPPPCPATRRALTTRPASQPRPSPADPRLLVLLVWSLAHLLVTSLVCLDLLMVFLASPSALCLLESACLRLRPTDTQPATETRTDSMIQFEHLRSEYRPPENRKFKWNWKTISTRFYWELLFSEHTLFTLMAREKKERFHFLRMR